MKIKKILKRIILKIEIEYNIFIVKHYFSYRIKLHKIYLDIMYFLGLQKFIKRKKIKDETILINKL